MKRFLIILFLFLFFNEIHAQRKIVLISARSNMGAYNREAIQAISIFEHLLNSDTLNKILQMKIGGYDFKNVRRNCNTKDTISINEAVAKYLNFEKDTKTITLQLNLKKKRKKRKSNVKGASIFDKYYINTYTWWLSENRLKFLIRYTAHIAHEYAHIKGFCHMDAPTEIDLSCNEDFPDASLKTFPYAVGCIVENYLFKNLIREPNGQIFLQLDGKKIEIK